MDFATKRDSALLGRCACGRAAQWQFDGEAVCRSCWEDLVSLADSRAPVQTPILVERLAAFVLASCALLGGIAIFAELLRKMW